MPSFVVWNHYVSPAHLAVLSPNCYIVAKYALSFDFLTRKQNGCSCQGAYCYGQCVHNCSFLYPFCCRHSDYTSGSWLREYRCVPRPSDQVLELASALTQQQLDLFASLSNGIDVNRLFRDFRRFTPINDWIDQVIQCFNTRRLSIPEPLGGSWKPMLHCYTQPDNHARISTAVFIWKRLKLPRAVLENEVIPLVMTGGKQEIVHKVPCGSCREYTREEQKKKKRKKQ